MSNQDILLETPDPGVLLITLNRPEVRNALRTTTLREIADVLDSADGDPEIRVCVITGGDKFFAAGADIKEMAGTGAVDMIDDPRQSCRRRIDRFSKPLVAAVNGYALGGGCELAMQADIVIAGDDARFGQPEINLGIIPGAGGTQRLIRTVGRSLAMKMVLSGEMIDAPAALAAGLVADIVPPELTVEKAVELARTIAAKPPLAVRLAKDAMREAFETSLSAGLNYERKAFTVLAGTEDRNEGLAAFMEKRKPRFTGR
ncbi:MAG: 2,3-dehydroadipyl-CoA hydratase PaaF [Gammaproteobacteria bacterium]|nr:2,3-dehydroadipyl-CoA hydratase PaaF [Gammaproteobacteria bacterium]